MPVARISEMHSKVSTRTSAVRYSPRAKAAGVGSWISVHHILKPCAPTARAELINLPQAPAEIRSVATATE